MTWSRRGRIGALLVAIALGVAACGSSADDGSSSSAREQGRPLAPSTRTRATSSSTFTASPPDATWTLVNAGVGATEQSWGDDTEGSNEPYLVVRRTDGDEGAPAIRVSVTSNETGEGGFAQASAGYNTDELEKRRVDGKQALYWPAADGHGADLLVDRGGDLAVKVDGFATEADLVRLEQATVPADDHALAPTMPSPPDGFEVVGSVDVDVVLAQQTYANATSDGLTGPIGSHHLGWVRPTAGGQPASIMAVTVPGGSADIDALDAVGRVERYQGSQLTTSARNVDGRSFALVEAHTDYGGGQPSFTRRSVVTETPWGDLLVVHATGNEVPSFDQMVTMAAGATRSDAAGWKALGERAEQGPGLHPEPGHRRIQRQESRDQGGYLLQDRGLGGGPSKAQVDGRLVADALPDPCLRLSTGASTCATKTVSAPDGTIQSGGPDQGMPAYLVVSTTLPAATVRVKADGGSGGAILDPLPGGRVRAGVVLISSMGPTGTYVCDGPSTGALRVELLDDAGSVIGCIEGS